MPRFRFLALQRRRSLVTALSAAFAVLGATTATPAMAQRAATAAESPRHAVELAPQALGAALNQLSRQTGVQVFAAGDVVAGLQAPAVSGQLSAGEALARLLAGSGLVAEASGNGFVIRQAPVGDITLSEVAVSASAETGGGAAAITEDSGSYTTRSMQTATRLPLSIRETPQSVTVVSRQRIEDQGMTSITDVVRNAPGLFLNSTDGPGRPDFRSRGFSVDTVMYDGMPSRFQGWVVGSQANLAMYDRVEVVRGATGMVTGSGTPSAAINLVRKRPTADTRVTLTGSAGSWENYRGELDAGGALNDSASLRGRVVASYQDAQSFRDDEKHDHGLFYGVLEADLGERTNLMVGVSHQDDSTNNFWGGLPLDAEGRHLGLPRSTLPGNDWERKNQRVNTAFGELSHRFDNGWKLRFAAMKAWQDAIFMGTYLQRNDLTGLGHAAYRADYDEDQSAYDGYASGPFQLLGREHELSVGVSRRQTELATHGYGGTKLITSGIDLWTWDPGSVPKPEFVYSGTTRNVTTQEGVYVASRLNLADPLKLIVGGRLDWYDYDNRSGSGDYKVTRNLTRYAGLIYDVDARHSLYASYTDIFTPQTSKGTDGNVLKPIVGENYEVGVKGEYFDGALNASASVFRIDQKNRAKLLDDQGACPTYPASSCYEAAGLVRSEGFELEVQGAVTPDWQVSAGYTFSEVEYVKDTNPANEGRPFATYLPKRMFKLATSYNLPGPLNAWRVGGSLYHQSSMYHDDSYNGVDYRIRQGGYTLVDVLLGYRVNKHLDLQLNVSNVFDKHYYSSIAGGIKWAPYDTYGDPRKFLLTAKYTF